VSPTAAHVMAALLSSGLSRRTRALVGPSMCSLGLPPPVTSSGCNRAAKLISRRMARTLRTTKAQAFGCPMSTTSRLPRVTPV
jgi:hypothetical protein